MSAAAVILIYAGGERHALITRIRRCMMKRFDVTALGELLIDFTENGLSNQGNPILEVNPGGAPCNVLAMLNNLGRKTAFIGKVGDDAFGHMLADTVSQSGTDTTGLVFDPLVHTTLAFVHTMPGGDRSFSFYRNPGADMMLRKDEISGECIRNSSIFHFGTLSSTHPGVRKATRHALQVARDSGALLSFDPNLRESLWDSLDDARREIEYGLTQCDILKISDNELEFLSGTADYDEGVRYLRDRFELPLIFVTMGASGSRAYYHDVMVEAPAFTRNDTIETSGAGDTFMGCILHHVLRFGISDLSCDILEKMLMFANAGASIITTRRGALKVMPTEDEIHLVLKQHGIDF